jgi:cytosine/adenosine deaminase-related metal-dependent hydrolase
MASREGESNGARLFTEALAGGAQALNRPIGAIASGRRADIVVFDPDHPDFAAAGSGRWLDAWIFVAGRSAIKDVFAGGRKVVEGGRHVDRAAIAARYRAALQGLADG